MNYQWGLLLSLLAAGTGLLVGGLIVLMIDPFTADVLSKGAFFAAVLLFSAGLAVPIFYWSKLQASNREVIFATFTISARQGLLLGLTVTALLVLQAIRALSWWDALLVVAGAGMIELALRSRT